jgi:hypothetical protein
MGLAIEVGFLADMIENDDEGAEWFRDDLKRLNQYLVNTGLQPHIEPEQCPVYSSAMWGYSGLHYLRRIAAHLDLCGNLPEPGDKDASRDAIVQEYYAPLEKPSSSLFRRLFGKKQVPRTYDHLMLHSDAEGYYLPRDFAHVLFPPSNYDIPGGMVGSSHRLLTETRQLAKALRLPLDMDPEDDEIWKAADSQGEGDLVWKRYGVESFTCLRLYHAAMHFINHSSVIVFC